MDIARPETRVLAGSTPEEHRDRQGQPEAGQTGEKEVPNQKRDNPAPRVSIGLTAAKASAISPLSPSPTQSRTFENMRLRRPQRPINSTSCRKGKTFLTSNALLQFRHG